MYKFGDKVTAIYENGERVVRIFLGEYEGRYLLIYGDVKGEEAESFYNIDGAPLTYWVDEIEEIITPTIDVGLDYEDLFNLGRAISENFTLDHEFEDHEGKPVKIVFMKKDEMLQRSN